MCRGENIKTTEICMIFYRGFSEGNTLEKSAGNWNCGKNRADVCRSYTFSL